MFSRRLFSPRFRLPFDWALLKIFENGENHACRKQKKKSDLRGTKATRLFFHFSSPSFQFFPLAFRLFQHRRSIGRGNKKRRYLPVHMAAGSSSLILKNPLVGGFIVLVGLLAIGDGLSTLLGFTFPFPSWLIAVLAAVVAVVVLWAPQKTGLIDIS